MQFVQTIIIALLVGHSAAILYNRNDGLLTSLKLTHQPYLYSWREANIGRFLDRNEWIGDFLSNIIRSDLSLEVKQLAKKQFLDSVCTITSPNYCVQDLQNTLCDAVKLYGTTQHDCNKYNDTLGCETCKTGVCDSQLSLAYTLKVFDSLGKPAPGIEYGDRRWTGSFDQCLQLKNSNNFHYCTAKFGIPMSAAEAVFSNKTSVCRPIGETEFIDVGICVPHRCSANFLTQTITQALATQEPDTFCHSEVVCSTETPIAKDGGTVFMILLSSMFLLLLVTGTAFDLVVFQPMTKFYPSHKDVNNGAVIVANGSTCASDLNIPAAQVYPSDTKTKELCFAELCRFMLSFDTAILMYTPYVVLAWYFKLLMAFSAYTNGHQVLNTQLPNDQISCLYGIRFITMCWIIYAHMYYFSLDYISNVAQVLKFPNSFLFQIINNASVSVDTFFVISGFLLAFTWLRKVARGEGKDLYSPLFWVKFYIRRLIRVLPVYMIILGLAASIWPHTGIGPLWKGHEDPNIKNCPKNFWFNLLFLNNLVKSDEMCLGWTWYIANEMQFYVLSPAVLVLFWVYPLLGMLLCFVLIAISAITVALVTSTNSFPPTFMFTNNPLDWTKLTDFAQEVFFMPYARWPAYVVGLFFGYFLWKHRSTKRLGPRLSYLLLSIAFIVSFAIVFGLHDYAQGYGIFSTVSALYACVHRPVWAICVAIVMFVCINGTAGYVGEVLSWKLWIPLSRLTFIVYLIHPLFIVSFFGTLSYPEHITHYGMLYHFISGNMITYGVAFFLHLLFEAPLMKLQKIFLESDWSSSEFSSTSHKYENMVLQQEKLSAPKSGLQPLSQRFAEIRGECQETFMKKKKQLPQNSAQMDGLVVGDKFGNGDQLANYSENEEPQIDDSGVNMEMVASNGQQTHQQQQGHEQSIV